MTDEPAKETEKISKSETKVERALTPVEKKREELQEKARGLWERIRDSINKNRENIIEEVDSARTEGVNSSEIKQAEKEVLSVLEKDTKRAEQAFVGFDQILEGKKEEAKEKESLDPELRKKLNKELERRFVEGRLRADYPHQEVISVRVLEQERERYTEEYLVSEVEKFDQLYQLVKEAKNDIVGLEGEEKGKRIAQFGEEILAREGYWDILEDRYKKKGVAVSLFPRWAVFKENPTIKETFGQEELRAFDRAVQQDLLSEAIDSYGREALYCLSEAYPDSQTAKALLLSMLWGIRGDEIYTVAEATRRLAREHPESFEELASQFESKEPEIADFLRTIKFSEHDSRDLDVSSLEKLGEFLFEIATDEEEDRRLREYAIQGFHKPEIHNRLSFLRRLYERYGEDEELRRLAIKSLSETAWANRTHELRDFLLSIWQQEKDAKIKIKAIGGLKSFAGTTLHYAVHNIPKEKKLFRRTRERIVEVGKERIKKLGESPDFLETNASILETVNTIELFDQLGTDYQDSDQIIERLLKRKSLPRESEERETYVRLLYLLANRLEKGDRNVIKVLARTLVEGSEGAREAAFNTWIYESLKMAVPEVQQLLFDQMSSEKETAIQTLETFIRIGGLGDELRWFWGNFSPEDFRELAVWLRSKDPKTPIALTLDEILANSEFSLRFRSHVLEMAPRIYPEELVSYLNSLSEERKEEFFEALSLLTANEIMPLPQRVRFFLEKETSQDYFSAIEKSAYSDNTKIHLRLDLGYYTIEEQFNRLNYLKRRLLEGASEKEISQTMIFLRRIPDKAVAEEMSIEQLGKMNEKMFYSYQENYRKYYPEAVRPSGSNVTFLINLADEVIDKMGIRTKQLRINGYQVSIPQGFPKFYREARKGKKEKIELIPAMSQFLMNEAAERLPAFAIGDITPEPDVRDTMGRRKSRGSLEILADKDAPIGEALWKQLVNDSQEQEGKLLLVIANESTAPRYVARNQLSKEFASKYGIAQNIEDERFLDWMHGNEGTINSLLSRKRQGILNPEDLEELRKLLNIAPETKIIPLEQFKVPSTIDVTGQLSSYLLSFLKIAEILDAEILFTDMSTRGICRALGYIYEFYQRQENPPTLQPEGKISSEGMTDRDQILNHLEPRSGSDVVIRFFDPVPENSDKPVGDDADTFGSVEGKVNLEKGRCLLREEPLIFPTPEGKFVNVEEAWQELMAERIEEGFSERTAVPS